MIPSKDINRMVNTSELAEQAFWGVVAGEYPEAVTGEFSPEAALAFSAAIEKAITAWLEWNADPEPIAQMTAEIMLHRIEYSYRGYPNMTLTDSDEEHIAYCISQGISSGELCTVPEDSNSEVYGYWEINNNPN